MFVDFKNFKNVELINETLESYSSSSPQTKEYTYTNNKSYPVVIILDHISHIRLLEFLDHTDIQVNDVNIQKRENNNSVLEQIYHSYNSTDYHFNNQRVVLEPGQKLYISMYNGQFSQQYPNTARLSLIARVIS